MNAAIIGAGSWGTALANNLAENGHRLRLWDIDGGLLGDISKERENKKYLPGYKLKDGIEISETLAACVREADFVITAVPAQHFRSALAAALPDIKEDAIIINVAKGIEISSQKTPSEIYKELGSERPFAVLSGPSHAEEVAEGMPTTVTAASLDEKTAAAVQDLFMNNKFRVYTLDDVIGVELGGAMKNVIALGAGIIDGMGYGDNTKAALMTRGLTEMARLGAGMGAQRETFFGLTGIGDLIVTCTSRHSRNRRCGIMIGEGVPPQEAIAKVGMIVEGVPTAEAANALAKKLGVELPITAAICRVLSGEAPPAAEMTALMTRGKKHEYEGFQV